MTQKDYLTGRWQNQRDYYSKQSQRAKRRYQLLQAFIGLGAIAITIVVSFPEVPRWVVAVCSGLVAGAAILEKVYRFGDNWRSFRQTLEGLKQERVFFEEGAGPYEQGSEEERRKRLVTRCEHLIAQETGSYFPSEKERSKKDESLPLGTAPRVGS